MQAKTHMTDWAYRKLLGALAVLLAALALLPVPAQAQTSCEAAKSAARQEWLDRGGPDGESGFEASMTELTGMIRADADWNNAAELRKGQAKGPGISPAIDAYLQCVVGARADELEGKAGAPSPGSQSSSTATAEATQPGSGYTPAGCELVQGSSSTGALSTESSSLTNKCPVRVGYVYCITGRNDGGQFSCTGQKFGSGWISAGGTDYISVAGTSAPFQVHWGYCLATPANERPLAVHAHWNGKDIDFDCR